MARSFWKSVLLTRWGVSCLWEGNGFILLFLCFIFLHTNCNTIHCSISPLLLWHENLFHMFFHVTYTFTLTNLVMFVIYTQNGINEKGYCNASSCFRILRYIPHIKTIECLSLVCAFKLQQFDWIKMHQKQQKNVVYFACPYSYACARKFEFFIWKPLNVESLFNFIGMQIFCLSFAFHEFYKLKELQKCFV